MTTQEFNTYLKQNIGNDFNFKIKSGNVGKVMDLINWKVTSVGDMNSFYFNFLIVSNDKNRKMSLTNLNVLDYKKL